MAAIEAFYAAWQAQQPTLQIYGGNPVPIAQLLRRRQEREQELLLLLEEV